ncbi:DUF2075 domain-containing protein [Mucilaginibacter aquariorum]|uniref:DUF2075 domain-containing protein n=1 Tax=Mucilaginibacter aquariorum TaxID=2967225 RepID=A0ABT1TAB5_9SPHI|nr:DUF2075 domain-containing protein [Mucilaginibacter aquariorum]MCQ6961357.1 DUF2075 domain-containing protein [Mucilaginibacter aquariorum]
MGAFYSNTIVEFLREDTLKISGSLSHEAGLAGFYDQKHTQTLSWNEEITLLKSSLQQLCLTENNSGNWGILLEYPIARRQKRIDVVIVANNVVIVIEFKIGKADYLNGDKEQVLDYCLDLRDFHFESRDKIIVPFLLATDGKSIENDFFNIDDLVKELVIVNALNLTENIIHAINKWNDIATLSDYKKWNNSDYFPTPTIVEAAQALYSGKSVIEISQSHARKKNLTKTSKAVVDAIKSARLKNEKIICFITGVPGAGKTLAGLNIAHDKELQGEGKSLATFLSGNAPLIKVLKKALSNDAFKKIKKDDKTAKQKSTDRIISFIENAHGFLEEYFEDKEKIPNNKIVIFDEAQRAWDAEQSKKKFKRNFSEAEMILEIMSRHQDWSVIVALVGGGQEINKGEAGLPEWGRAIEQKFGNWKIYISPQLKIGNHSTGNLSLFEHPPQNLSIIENEALHLDVSIRSFKAEKLSLWVSLILNNNQIEASKIFNSDLTKYKIALTRDLSTAKNWLRSNCKGTRRMGLVATSGARRLMPYGFDIRMPLEEAEWFLNDRNDVRSSYYLELAATEYRIQGLELDWVGLCWDLDLRRNKDVWDFKTFSGTKWQNVKALEKQQFFINKYRVLLTRAREGMIIFVPPGDVKDPTRKPSDYNQIADYLISCGVKEI